MFHLVFVFGLLCGHLMGNLGYSHGMPGVLIVFCLFEISFISPFGFKSEFCF